MKKSWINILPISTLLFSITPIFSLTSCSNKSKQFNFDYDESNPTSKTSLIGQSEDLNYYVDVIISTNATKEEFNEMSIFVKNAQVSILDSLNDNDNNKFKIRISWTSSFVSTPLTFKIQFWNNYKHESLIGEIDECCVTWEDLNLVQFIQNRTFALKATLEYTDPSIPWMEWRVMDYATGWIIEDATKNIEDDYVYYLATSWNFINLAETLEERLPQGCIPDPNGIKFSFANINSVPEQQVIIDSINDFEDFDTDDFTIMDKSNFIFNQFSNDMAPAIDFYVCQVDFSITKHERIIDQLDNLNEYRKQHGSINTFVDGASATIKSKNKYVGGYQWAEDREKGESGVKWFFSSSNPSDQQYYDFQEKTHYIGYENQDQTLFPYYDVGNQMVATKSIIPKSPLNSMTGSMLLTNDFEICGSYWGLITEDQQHFLPSFSIFKTNQYDFISKWI